MTTLILFSKDRRLQLQAYLSSLDHNVDNIECVNIITPNDISYNQANTYNEDDFGSFNETFLKCLADVSTEYILFGCDDCIWTRHVDLKEIEPFLDREKDVLGFSLRLGTNITRGGSYKLVSKDDWTVKWDWRNSHGHYNYCFELMGTLYRTELVRRITKQSKPFRTPNCIESCGVNYCWNNPVEPYMMMLNRSGSLVAQDVNRVQNLYENKFDGNEEHSISHLDRIWRAGGRIDFANLDHITPDDVFVGKKYWKII